MELKGMFDDAAAAMRYMSAGKAVVTARSTRTGARFTYRLRESDDKRVLFVGMLDGPDNTSHYAYLGTIRRSPSGPGLYFHGKRSRVSEGAPGAVAFKYVWEKLAKGHLPGNLEVWHEGRCGRCHRALTVPESVASGFGPECRNHV